MHSIWQFLQAEHGEQLIFLRCKTIYPAKISHRLS